MSLALVRCAQFSRKFIRYIAMGREKPLSFNLCDEREFNILGALVTRVVLLLCYSLPLGSCFKKTGRKEIEREGIIPYEASSRVPLSRSTTFCILKRFNGCDFLFFFLFFFFTFSKKTL